ncbi:MAG: c-type cytochrome, partial [Verrucomicrobiota bacterium]
LSDWENPSPLDRVMGLWRPLAKREIAVAQNAFHSVSSELFKSDSEKVLLAAVRCARKLKLNEAALFPIFKTSPSPAVRVEILQTLAEFKSDALPKAVEFALADSNRDLRREGIKSVALLAPEQTPLLLEKLLATETDLRINQTAFATLGKLTNAAAAEVLHRQLDLLLAGKIAPELQLDLLDAAEKHSDSRIVESLKRYKASLPQNNSLAEFLVALVGGDAVRGKKIFHEREDVACLRCHAIKGVGGNVGPDLNGIATRQSRGYLLESILEPNKQIAPGFENIVVTLKNGTAAAGLVKSEDKNELVLNSPEDGIVRIKKEEIEKRERGLSSMPEGMTKVLTQFELRDLIEFLANLK